ncbi:serine/threonine protein kinase [Ordospora pajunii]|uniref:serine/threonine protein kinase n=1 Tax=Ordospora pajunii TaxID=3039483 RepID=UPI0029527C9E|nr:serine/threonine protein kinase [Ordospora pajunii]KAH9411908.1 serine/threonine protein kinase [Ordospora pajunii]
MAENQTLDDFEIGRLLGRGKFGQVWLAREKTKGHIVALKIIPINAIQTPETARQVRREIEIHSNLKHPNILRMYGHFYDKENIYLILEYAGKGEFFKFLSEKGGKFGEKETSMYIKQVVQALMYMRECNVIHRDIKPENLLLGADDQLKIADFGWAVYNADKRRMTFCGTMEYLAPEMVNNDIHNSGIDLWCLGILTYEFLTGKTPFESKNRNMREAYKRINSLKYTIPETISPNASDFIAKLLVFNPSDRMELNEALNHPFIIKHCGRLN